MLKINSEGGFFMKKTDELTMAMIEYFGGDAKRIQHFIKVHAFSRLIGESEGLELIPGATENVKGMVCYPTDFK